MSKATSLNRQEERANQLRTVGMPVIVTKDDGTKLKTKTRSEPWLMGGHSWVVMVEGISGGYAIMRVEPDSEAP